MQLHGKEIVFVRVFPNEPRPGFPHFRKRAAFFRRFPTGGDRWHEYAILTPRSDPKLYCFFHFEGPKDEEPGVAREWLLKQYSGRSKPSLILQAQWAKDGYVLSARRLAVAQYVNNAVRTAPEWAPRVVVLYTMGFSAVAYCQEHKLPYEIEKASAGIPTPDVVPWVNTLKTWARATTPQKPQGPKTAWQFLMEGE